MHKCLFNEVIIKLTIEPVGPILIKAGDGGSDPTKPDMSFVRTMRNGESTVYLPGSSLKGFLRSHCEKLARTVGLNPLCSPVDDKSSCGKKLEKEKVKEPKAIHKDSCFICRLFGNTALASHFRSSDAYLKGEYRTEERNGVAIDRVFGSAVGGALFNYETVTSGQFETTLYIKNFSLAQLGLLSLMLRDLSAERMRLGFAKSRGMGLVKATVTELTLRYPLAQPNAANKISGIGKFIPDAASYGYGSDDEADLPEGFSVQTDDWGELEIRAPQADGKAQWEKLGQLCARHWKAEATNGN